MELVGFGSCATMVESPSEEGGVTNWSRTALVLEESSWPLAVTTTPVLQLDLLIN
jgi:hypothetical protein